MGLDERPDPQSAIDKHRSTQHTSGAGRVQGGGQCENARTGARACNEPPTRARARNPERAGAAFEPVYRLRRLIPESMADLAVENKSRTGLLAWAYFFGLLILGVVLYFVLEALAPPPDRVDKDLVHLARIEAAAPAMLHPIS